MNINISGAKYKIIYVKDNSFMLNEDHTGECNYSDKTIKVSKSSDGEENSTEWQRETLLHELAHCFLYETGQSDINDERHAELLGKFVRFVEWCKI